MTYKWRHLVENVFCDLKDVRRIALRTNKTDLSFAEIINACAALLNGKRISTDPSSQSLFPSCL
jgi:transposase